MRKKIKKTYDYKNINGEIVSQTVRFDPKGFSQRRPMNGNFAWALSAGWYEQCPPKNDFYLVEDASHNPQEPPHRKAIWLNEIEPVLYRLPELIDAIKKRDTIFICEGEKDADNLINFGFPTTTSPMGAGKWRKLFTQSLIGCKECIIIADKDDCGRKHAEMIANDLIETGIVVKIIELPDKNDSSVKDFSDWLEAGGTKFEFNEIINQASSWQPKTSCSDLFSETNNDELYRKLVSEYGEPYYTNRYGDVSALNESFWAGLHNAENIELYEPVEQAFYRYNSESGTYREISENLLKKEISNRILKESQEKNLLSLERQRRNSVLNNIVSLLKGIAEKQNPFKKTSSFVHLSNGIILFEDKQQANFLDFSPSFYSRNKSPINFKPEARCEHFINEFLLPSVSEDDEILIQKYTGLCLLGTNLIQRLIILDGKPERGKTTLCLIIQKLVGLNNVTELRTKHLSQRFELYRYLKKTLLVGVDVPGNFLSEKGAYVIKGLVGGDWFDAEQKGGTDSFQLQGDFCIVITSNSRLQVRLDGDVGAWKRRLLIVRFESPPPSRKIPNFADYLMEKEGSGILNWALQGLAMVLEDINKYGDINLGIKQQAIVEAILAESDSLRHFLLDCVVKDDDKDLASSEIVEAYAEYCPSRKWNPKPITIIHRELEGLMLELFGTSKSHSIERDGKSVRGFRRVCLKNQE